MAEHALEAVEITSGDEPALAVIWLHGLGADGHDFEPIVEELRLPFGVRFVFPHAPVRAVTINGGLRMRAWYDILGFGPNAPEDEAGIRESARLVGALIDEQVAAGFGTAQVVLAGFSQGGAIALHTGLREPRPLAGLVALSSYLPLAPTLTGERSGANARVPLFVAHGSADPIIPIAAAEASRRALESAGYLVEWRSYPMAHAVCGDEVRDIREWLEARAREARAPAGFPP